MRLAKYFVNVKLRITYKTAIETKVEDKNIWRPLE